MSWSGTYKSFIWSEKLNSGNYSPAPPLYLAIHYFATATQLILATVDLNIGFKNLKNASKNKKSTDSFFINKKKTQTNKPNKPQNTTNPFAAEKRNTMGRSLTMTKKVKRIL